MEVSSESLSQDEQPENARLFGDIFVAPNQLARYCSSQTLSDCWRNIRSHWRIVAFGQALSFLLACSGAAQATLSFQCHLSAPTFTVGLFYVCLAGFLIPVYRQNKHVMQESPHGDGMLRQEEGDRQDGSSRANAEEFYRFLSVLPLRGPAWAYLVMAVLDVYANYFTVLAFKWTTITSVTLFDALAIPSAMILSRAFLARSYTTVHLLGVGSCMMGIIFNVLQDLDDDLENGHTGSDDILAKEFPHKLRGDLLAILGGLLFGANNVLGEVAVRNLGGPYEYVGMLGFFATIICSIQTLLLERQEVAEFWQRPSQTEGNDCSRFMSMWLLFGFVACNVLGYVGASHFLQISEAAFFNLSLLTGDLWSVMFSVFAEHIVPHPFFFVALVFTVSGVIVYEMAPSPVAEDRDEMKQQTAWRENHVERLEMELRLYETEGTLT